MDFSKQQKLKENTQILVERSRALMQEAAALRDALRETVLANKTTRNVRN